MARPPLVLMLASQTQKAYFKEWFDKFSIETRKTSSLDEIEDSGLHPPLLATPVPVILPFFCF